MPCQQFATAGRIDDANYAVLAADGQPAPVGVQRQDTRLGVGRHSAQRPVVKVPIGDAAVKIANDHVAGAIEQDGRHNAEGARASSAWRLWTQTPRPSLVDAVWSTSPTSVVWPNPVLAKGDPGNTLSRSEIEPKARQLVAYGGGAGTAEMHTLIARVWQMAHWPRVESLLQDTTP
jgi:hypothetical protein